MFKFKTPFYFYSTGVPSTRFFSLVRSIVRAVGNRDENVTGASSPSQRGFMADVWMCVIPVSIVERGTPPNVLKQEVEPGRQPYKELF